MKRTLLSEIKRNRRVYQEIQKATDLRVAYKTETGWKRLRCSPEDLRAYAGTVVMDRLDAMLPVAIERAMNKLVDEFNQ